MHIDDCYKTAGFSTIFLIREMFKDDRLLEEIKAAIAQIDIEEPWSDESLNFYEGVLDELDKLSTRVVKLRTEVEAL
jgi:rubrerythrin